MTNHKINHSNIRWRLIVAFTAITLMTVSSALLSWIYNTSTTKRLTSILEENLPIVSHAQILAREVASFTSLATEFAHVESEEILAGFKHERDNIVSRSYLLIDELDNFNFHSEQLNKIRFAFNELNNNIHLQADLAALSLQQHAKLIEKVDYLRTQHTAFITLTDPQIDDAYKIFLQHGAEIEQQINRLLTKKEQDSQKSIQNRQKQVRVAFATLINGAAGEMRANLEVVATTYLLAGIYYEAAQLEDINQIEALRQRYLYVQDRMKKLRLILSHSTPANRKLMSEALQLLNFGKGNHSIFQIRKMELFSRQSIIDLNAKNKQLDHKLTLLTRNFAELSQQDARTNTSNLSQSLVASHTAQMIGAFIAVCITILIGWRYVGKGIVIRILHLKQIMEDHGAGEKVNIPVSGNDEITDMAKALQGFVKRQQQTEYQLRKSLQSLHAAHRIARIGNCERNPDSKKWHWSKGFYEIIGFSPEELEAGENSFWNMVHYDDVEKMERFFNKLENTDETVEEQFRLFTKINEVRIIQASWKQFPKNREHSFQQNGNFQDITDRRLIEEELLRIRKLESIGVLAGGIAHDFNNLLTGILGNLSLLERMIEEKHTAHNSLILAKNASLKAKELTTKLLTFADGGEQQTDTINLNEVMHNMARLALTSTDIKLETKLPDELWNLDIDTAQINQVIQNLVINAEQAMNGSGNITITCSNKILQDSQIGSLPGGKYVTIEINDDGPGIDKHNLERIFDPYFSTKKRDANKGSGLGLAIVYSIVTKHKGTVTVHSETHRGTYFTIYLPAGTGIKQPVEQPVDDILFGSGRILIMDDEQIVQNVAKNMLEFLGYTVVQAFDGEEAIELYNQHVRENKKINLVIMDISIPNGMGGKEAAKILKRDYPKINILVSSGYTNDEAIKNPAKFGFCGFVRKPYKLNDLSEVVAKTMHG